MMKIFAKYVGNKKSNLDKKMLQGICEIIRSCDFPFNAFSVKDGHILYLTNIKSLNEQELDRDKIYGYFTEKGRILHSLYDDSLLLPDEYYTLTGDSIEPFLIGFPILPRKGYVELRKMVGSEGLSLDDVSKPVLAVSRAVKKSAEKGTYHSNLFSEDNIYYNPDEDKAMFDDFANVQVNGLYVDFSAASLLAKTAFAYSHLFDRETKRVDENFSKIALHLLFIRVATGKYPPVFEKSLFTKPKVRELCDGIGLSDTQFEDNLLRISDERELVYPDEAIKELKLTHKLVPSDKSYTFMRR